MTETSFQGALQLLPHLLHVKSANKAIKKTLVVCLRRSYGFCTEASSFPVSIGLCFDYAVLDRPTHRATVSSAHQHLSTRALPACECNTTPSEGSPESVQDSCKPLLYMLTTASTMLQR